MIANGQSNRRFYGLSTLRVSLVFIARLHVCVLAYLWDALQTGAFCFFRVFSDTRVGADALSSLNFFATRAAFWKTFGLGPVGPILKNSCVFCVFFCIFFILRGNLRGCRSRFEGRLLRNPEDFPWNNDGPWS